MPSDTERRTDRRTLQRLAELALERRDGSQEYGETWEYWNGVNDGIRQALGQEIFAITEVKKFTIQRVSPSSAVTGVAAPAKSTTPETDTNGI